MGTTVAVIAVVLATLILETATVKFGLVGEVVDTLTVVTGQPVAVANAGVTKPVPVIVRLYDWPANHTLGVTGAWGARAGVVQTGTANVAEVLVFAGHAPELALAARGSTSYLR